MRPPVPPPADPHHSRSPHPSLPPPLRRLLWRWPLLLLILLLELFTLPRHALAQSCTPTSGTDWMIVTDPFAQDIRPRDCETVQQTPPDFRWPDVISTGSYQITLTYPDGHARTLTAGQNWINWDEQLVPGTYAWTVSYPGGSASKTRRFVVDSNSKPFLVPAATTMLATATGKAHPRSLPDATTLATMRSQRGSAVNQLLTDVSGRFTSSLPTDGTADDAFQYSKYALNALMACAYTSQDSYCNDAIRRVVNLASWNPTGASAYTTAGADMGGRYLTWTIATGYDWLYPRLPSPQRSQILATINTRTAQLYNDLIGTRSRIAQAPRDSHGNQALSYLAVITTLVAGDLSAANTWLTNSLPLAINAASPWGGPEGGFANAETQGNWDVGELLPLWEELKLSTGVDMAQKAWVRNWGGFFTYFTPPGMAGGTTEFGDGFEENELEHQSRFMKGYTNFAPSPLARWHASNLSAEDPTRIEFLMSPPADYTGSQPFPSGTPNSALFPYIGQAAMHSDLSSPTRTSVYFKSSPPPYGAFNHSHADQNSFVVNAGGQRLAIESGYYDDYKTQHWYNWYHTTQAKNAITYDGGQGQVFYEKDNQLGYGIIKRFYTSPAYDAVTGDATQAYNGALSLAQRTLVYLRPNLILVYDNLASSSNRQWEWNFHALNQMTNTSDTKATITSGGQTLCVSMLAGPAMHFTQTNQFTSDPTSSGWTPQWHGRFYSTTKSAATEFIALLDVGCTKPAANAVKSGSTWTVGLGSQTFTIGTDGSVAQVGSSAGATSGGTTTDTSTAATTGASGPTSSYTTTMTTTSSGTLSGWLSNNTTSGTTSNTTSATGTKTTTAPTTGTTSGGTTSLLPALALPTTGVIAIPTFESVGLYWQPGTNPGSAGCTLQYKKSIESTWKNALSMWYDSRNSQCRGSVVQLQPATSYDFQLGLPGQAPSRQQRVTTWSETFPIARTVTLPPGTTNQTLNITQGGSASGYVLYTTDPTAQSVIDSANASPYNVVISAPYVIVRGLVLKGAGNDGIRLTDTAHDVVIENNDISGWGRSRGATSQFGYTLGVDMDSGIHAVCTTQNMVRTVVQRNKIHDPRYGANSWTEGHPLGPQGLSYESCGGNHVIRYNEIWSSSGHYYNDGLGGAENFSTVGFPNRDSDLYGNLIQNTWDDAIESEGGDMNVRIWGNYFNNTNTGAASTVDALGPLYIFRNVHNRSRQLEGTPLDSDERNVFAKSGSTSLGGGRRYIFHNTTLQATQSGVINGLGVGSAISGTGATQLIANTISRNNIFQVWKNSSPMVFQSGAGNDYGYDLYNGPAGVIETNGVQGMPIYATGNGWTSEANGMYQQAPTSPGYDKGVRIPNFNDVFTGIAPDIGAHEAGTAAMVFGVKGGTTAAGTTRVASTGTTSGTTSGATSTNSAGTKSGAPVAASTPYTGTPIALPGTFEAENFDKGGEGVAYHDTTPGNQGGQYRLAEDVDIITSTDPAGGGYVINNFATGEWLAYTIAAATSGQYVFELRVSNNTTGTPAFHLEVDGDRVAAATVPNTGSWSNFLWVATPRVTLTRGKHLLKIVADQQYFNLNSVRATLVATTGSASSMPFNIASRP